MRGVVRRNRFNGLSIQATGAWDLAVLNEQWKNSLTDGLSEKAASDLINKELSRRSTKYSDAMRHRLKETIKTTNFGANTAQEVGIFSTHLESAVMQSCYQIETNDFNHFNDSNSQLITESMNKVPHKLWHSSPGSAGQ